jgi:hypothetical protein
MTGLESKEAAATLPDEDADGSGSLQTVVADAIGCEFLMGLSQLMPKRCYNGIHEKEPTE